MKEILFQYKSLIIGVFCGIGVLVFRKEFNKLIDWVVSFKRLTKTKDGYTASSSGELGGKDETIPSSTELLPGPVMMEIVESKQEAVQVEENWVTPFLAKDYSRAAEIIRGRISNEEDPKKRAEHRAVLGHVIYEQDRQKGLEYFEDLIRGGENERVVYSWYGFSLYWDGDYSKAVEIVQAGIRVHPSDPELSRLLALNYHQQNNTSGALECLFDNIRQHPKDAQSYTALAQLFASIGMPDQAINCCWLGMIRCPKDVDLIEKYLKFLPPEGRSQERMLAYLRLTEINPTNQTYWVLLGNEYLQLGFNDLALEAYHEGNELAEEKEAWILGNIGNILNNRGFYSFGAKFLKRAVSIDPDSQYAHERLGQALKLAMDEQVKRDDVRKEINQRSQSIPSLESTVEVALRKLSQPVASPVETTHG